LFAAWAAAKMNDPFTYQFLMLLQTENNDLILDQIFDQVEDDIYNLLYEQFFLSLNEQLANVQISIHNDIEDANV
jgi:hypothetical protein